MGLFGVSSLASPLGFQAADGQKGERNSVITAFERVSDTIDISDAIQQDAEKGLRLADSLQRGRFATRGDDDRPDSEFTPQERELQARKEELEATLEALDDLKKQRDYTRFLAKVASNSSDPVTIRNEVRRLKGAQITAARQAEVTAESQAVARNVALPNFSTIERAIREKERDDDSSVRALELAFQIARVRPDARLSAAISVQA